MQATKRHSNDAPFRRHRATALLVSLIAGLGVSVAGCSKSSATTTTQTTGAEQHATDLAGLREYIDVPGDPVSVAWGPIPLGITDGRAPGPTDYRFVAVIEYPSADAAAAAAGLPTGASSTVETAAWFPPDVVAVAQPNANGNPSVAVDEFAPSPAWVDTARVVTDAPQFVIVDYKPRTN